jgi:hypothetical protein
MVLFIKIMLAVIAGSILLVFIDLINGLRGKPTDYAGDGALIGEGVQLMSVFALAIIVLSLALFLIAFFIFG